MNVPRRALVWALSIGQAVLALMPGASRAQDAPASGAAARAAPDTLVLTLADVRRLSLRQNPAFLAERQETAIARGELRQARIYRFNPDLSALAPRGSGSSAELTLMQEIEWAGQRGLRIGAARTGLTRASASVRNAGRLTLAEASVAFYRALAAQRRLSVTQDVLALNERLLAAVRIQLREGELSTLEGNLAEIEFGRARGRVLTARRAATSATLELTRQLGLGPDVSVRLVGDTSSTANIDVMAVSSAPPLAQDSLIALAFNRRPDLIARIASVREFETLTSLARREAIPNIRVGAATERSTGGGSPGVGLALGLSLPFLNRGQGVVAQRRAQAEQARLALRATELRVRTELVDALRAYRTASDEAAVFQQMVLRPARQNTQLLESAYRAGKIPLPTLLLLRNQLLDAELGYWDAWLAQREAVVRLGAATGDMTADELNDLTIYEPDSRTTR